MIDDYDVHIRDYCRMSLHLAEKVLNMKIPLNIIEKDVPKIMHPLYNRDKIYDRPIINVEIGRDENDDIDHRGRHVVALAREWIRKPFQMDPIPQVIYFQATTRPTKGKGTKVTIPTYPAKSPVRSKMIQQHEWKVEYFEADKGKGKRKRSAPRERKQVAKAQEIELQ